MGFLSFILTWIVSVSWSQEGLSRRILNPSYTPKSSRVPVLFLDADSTVRVSQGGHVYPLSPTDYYILPGVAEKIRSYNQLGYLVAIVSNQGGISAGNIAIDVVDGALRNMVSDLYEKHQARVDYYDFAENKATNDPDRKPAIGMAERLQQKLKAKFGSHNRIDLERSLMVGDAAFMSHENRPDGRAGADFSNFDRGFARNLGVKYLEPHQFFGWERFGFERLHKMKDAQYYEMLSAPRSCRGRILMKK